MANVIDESQSFADFGAKYLDRRITRAMVHKMHLQHPTYVQSQAIPIALEGRDLLIRARTGSGKTLAYAVPVVAKMLEKAERGKGGEMRRLRAFVLVPTKELCVQVYEVMSTLLSFCNELVSADFIISSPSTTAAGGASTDAKKQRGDAHSANPLSPFLLSKGTATLAELPTILIATPTTLVSFLSVLERRGRGSAAMAGVVRGSIKDMVEMIVVDEADLLFSFGYEEDMRALCRMLPSTSTHSYNCILVSATLNKEVEELKGLMLHKPVILKVEETEGAGGDLHQFYLECVDKDKNLILYALIKLNLVQGKTLIFVSSVDRAYGLKLFLERFSIPSAVLNPLLPHASRQTIIQSFNQSLFELLIATDESVEEDDPSRPTGSSTQLEDVKAEEDGSDEEEQDDEEEDDDEPEEVAAEGEQEDEGDELDDVDLGEDGNEGGDGGGDAIDDDEDEEMDMDEEDGDAEGDEIDLDEEADEQMPNEQLPAKLKKKKQMADAQFGVHRGLDLQNVAVVINADMPRSVKGYLHRVGRTARAGAMGTALTLVSERQEDKMLMNKIEEHQRSPGSPDEPVVRALPLNLKDIECFRYRVEDVSRGVTKRAIAAMRARELQREALHSAKLKAHFQENPQDAKALKRSARQLKEHKSVYQHLRHLPKYLVPAQMMSQATPVQQAVRDQQRDSKMAAAAAASGVGEAVSASASGVKKRRQRVDPLKAVEAQKGFRALAVMPKNKRLITRKTQLRREPDYKMAAPETLPAISGRKLWKLRHKKRVSNPGGAGSGQPKRAKKFIKKKT